MHTATIHTDPIHFQGQKLTPGRYWLNDPDAAMLLHEGGGWGNVTLQRELLPDITNHDVAMVTTVVCAGGFSEMLWLNAIFDEIKRRRQGIKITAACGAKYKDMLLGFADRVTPYPIASFDQDLDKYHSVYWLENWLERHPVRGTEHPCDRLARFFGLEPLARKAAYQITDKERKWAENQLRIWTKRVKRPVDPDRIRVGVQLCSSETYQIQNYQQIGKVMQALGSIGCEIVTVGAPDPRKVTPPATTYHGPGNQHTIRESIAMISTCDVILSSGGAFVHVGAALDIPVVGIYGPADGTAHMQGQRGTVLQGALKCSPCHHVPRESYMPLTGPCAKSGVCDAVEGIDLTRIVKAVLAFGKRA